MSKSVVVATWKFGRIAARTGLAELEAGRPALDAAIAGAAAVEDDPSVLSVGYGGLPNSAGTVQLDSCVMDGATLSCGAVACLENIRHPSAVARRVMERTPHLLLVGEGARLFAVREGFSLECLQTPASLAEWERRKAKKQQPARRGDKGRAGEKRRNDNQLTHDTVTVLARDASGNLGGCCSTSGLSHKMPGRVADSPLIGGGLYVDNAAGAAGATGVGEEIIRAGGSILIVEMLRAGRSPQEACEAMIRRVIDLATRRGQRPAQVAFLSLDPAGNVGGACTKGTDFWYAVGRGGKIDLIKAPELGQKRKASAGASPRRLKSA